MRHAMGGRGDSHGTREGQRCGYRMRGDLFALALLAVATGCRPAVPPESPPAGPPVSPTVNAPRPVVAKPRLQDIRMLPADRDVKFAVRAPGHSLAVVQHFDAELAKRGWKKRSEGDDRKW